MRLPATPPHHSGIGFPRVASPHRFRVEEDDNESIKGDDASPGFFEF